MFTKFQTPLGTFELDSPFSDTLVQANFFRIIWKCPLFRSVLLCPNKVAVRII